MRRFLAIISVAACFAIPFMLAPDEADAGVSSSICSMYQYAEDGGAGGINGAAYDVFADAGWTRVNSFKSSLSQGDCTVTAGNGTCGDGGAASTCQDEITLSRAGPWVVTLSLSAAQTAAGFKAYETSVFLNNTLVEPCTFEWAAAQNQTERGAVTCTVSPTAGQKIDARIRGLTDGTDLSIPHINMAAFLKN